MSSTDRSQTERIRRLRATIQATRHAKSPFTPEEGPQGPLDQSTRLSRHFGQMSYYRQNATGATVSESCCAKNFDTVTTNLQRILVVSFLVFDDRWANPAQQATWWLNSQFGTLIFNTALNGGSPWVWEDTNDYGDVFAYFNTLKAEGAKLLLSLGGATSNIASIIPDNATASNLGQSLAILCGGTGNNPLNFPSLKDHKNNPFSFDGVDFDFETACATDTTTMTTLLSTLRAAAPNIILSCAPQPAYVFSATQYPSAFNANGKYNAYASISSPLSSLIPTGTPALLDAANIGNFNLIFMQYYNQTSDQYPGGANFSQILAQLAYLAQKATQKPLVYIGLLADPNGGSYPSPIPDPSTLIAPIETGINAAQALLVAALPAITIPSWLGGIMVWDSPLGNAYAATIVTGSTILSGLQTPIVLYGGQSWSPTPPGPTNPGW